MARPAGDMGRLPAVLIIHENRGLNPHIEDVVRRMALEGFVALGVDFLSPAGGTPADEDKAREMIGQLDMDQTVQNAVAAVDYLANHPRSEEHTSELQSLMRISYAGFCLKTKNTPQ